MTIMSGEGFRRFGEASPSRNPFKTQDKEKEVGPGGEVRGLACLGSTEGPMNGRSPQAREPQNNYNPHRGLSGVTGWGLTRSRARPAISL